MSRLQYWVGDRVRSAKEFFEDQWFDWSRGVRTSRNVSREDAGIPAAEFADSEAYQPARPSHIRYAIAASSVQDFRDYVYIDLGSGKGRSLFVAAEKPFREVIGVELSRRLHEQAAANVGSFRSKKRQSGPIVTVHGDAKDFLFPDRQIVLYLFNPFGLSTTRDVLLNLAESLRRRPRHVVLILLWPKYTQLVAQIESMHLRIETPFCQLFEAHAPGRQPTPGLLRAS